MPALLLLPIPRYDSINEMVDETNEREEACDRAQCAFARQYDSPFLPPFSPSRPPALPPSYYLSFSLILVSEECCRVCRCRKREERSLLYDETRNHDCPGASRVVYRTFRLSSLFSFFFLFFFSFILLTSDLFPSFLISQVLPFPFLTSKYVLLLYTF